MCVLTHHDHSTAFVGEAQIPLRLPYSLLGMAGAVHGAMGAVTAAGGLSLLLLPKQGPDDKEHNHDQDKTDQNGTNIRANPLQHLNHSFSSILSLNQFLY